MPGEVIDQPNPPPLTSQLPDSIEELAVKPAKASLNNLDLCSLRDFQRAACYIASGMLHQRLIDIPHKQLTASSNDIPQGQCPFGS